MQKVAPRNKEEAVPGLLVISAWERTFGHRGLRQQRRAQGSKVEREVVGCLSMWGQVPAWRRVRNLIRSLHVKYRF